ncbi:hypothetical protein Tco_0211491 [Tanacetum coccineum]
MPAAPISPATYLLIHDSVSPLKNILYDNSVILEWLLELVLEEGIVDIVVSEGLLMKKDIDETGYMMIGHELNVRHCHSDIPHVVDQLVKANIVLIDVFTWKHLEPFKLIIQQRFSVFFCELRTCKKHFDVLLSIKMQYGLQAKCNGDLEQNAMILKQNAVITWNQNAMRSEQNVDEVFKQNAVGLQQYAMELGLAEWLISMKIRDILCDPQKKLKETVAFLKNMANPHIPLLRELSHAADSNDIKDYLSVLFQREVVKDL